MEPTESQPAPTNTSKGRYRRRSKKRQQSQQLSANAQGDLPHEEEGGDDDEGSAVDPLTPNPWQEIVDEPEAALPGREKQNEASATAEVEDPISVEATGDDQSSAVEPKGLRVQIEGLVPQDFNPNSDDEVIEIADDARDRAVTGSDTEETRLLVGTDDSYGATKEDVFPRTDPGHEPFDLHCPVCGHSGPTVVTHERSCGKLTPFSLPCKSLCRYIYLHGDSVGAVLSSISAASML